tara:strand:+ start:133 stop:501 length:369 start_codon:yes stop_codon:yes gene_type:complete
MKLAKFIKRLFERSIAFDKELESAMQEVKSDLLEQARLNATIFPRRISGDLYNSIKVGDTIVDNRYRLFLQAGDQKVNYAGFVEFGTNRIAPRLYLTKAFAKVDREMPDKLKKFITLYLRKI